MNKKDILSFALLCVIIFGLFCYFGPLLFLMVMLMVAVIGFYQKRRWDNDRRE